MIKTYHISGMTCQGCVASVTDNLTAIDEVEAVQINLEKGEAEIKMKTQIGLSNLKTVLPEKYAIVKKEADFEQGFVKPETNTSKLEQLKPLLLIFAYLFTASFLFNYNDWDTREAMHDFMGLFYICLLYTSPSPRDS